MKKNYTFSNLPIAAIVLLISSLPCLAQVTANESTSVLAVADNGPTFALNKTMRAVPPSTLSTPSIEDTAVTVKSVERKSPLNLSAATFKVSDQFSVNSKSLTRTQLNSEVVAPDSKEQFRLDDDTLTTQRSKVTFVPSRGFKLPN
jgi:hypothetical protein